MDGLMDATLYEVVLFNRTLKPSQDFPSMNKEWSHYIDHKGDGPNTQQNKESATTSYQFPVPANGTRDVIGGGIMRQIVYDPVEDVAYATDLSRNAIHKVSFKGQDGFWTMSAPRSSSTTMLRKGTDGCKLAVDERDSYTAPEDGTYVYTCDKRPGSCVVSASVLIKKGERKRCANSVFGDPCPGTEKRCLFIPDGTVILHKPLGLAAWRDTTEYDARKTGEDALPKSKRQLRGLFIVEEETTRIVLMALQPVTFKGKSIASGSMVPIFDTLKDHPLANSGSNKWKGRDLKMATMHFHQKTKEHRLYVGGERDACLFEFLVARNSQLITNIVPEVGFGTCSNGASRLNRVLNGNSATAKIGSGVYGVALVDDGTTAIVSCFVNGNNGVFATITNMDKKDKSTRYFQVFYTSETAEVYGFVLNTLSPSSDDTFILYMRDADDIMTYRQQGNPNQQGGFSNTVHRFFGSGTPMTGGTMLKHGVIAGGSEGGLQMFCCGVESFILPVHHPGTPTQSVTVSAYTESISPLTPSASLTMSFPTATRSLGTPTPSSTFTPTTSNQPTTTLSLQPSSTLSLGTYTPTKHQVSPSATTSHTAIPPIPPTPTRTFLPTQTLGASKTLSVSRAKKVPHTVTVSASLVPPTPIPKTPQPTLPPPPKKEKDKKKAVLNNALGNEEAAEAVNVASTAAPAAAAVVNPAAATNAARVASIAAIADCTFGDDAFDPSPWEHPIPLKLGDSEAGVLAGSALMSLLVFVAPFVGTIAILYNTLAPPPPDHNAEGMNGPHEEENSSSLLSSAPRKKRTPPLPLLASPPSEGSRRSSKTIYDEGEDENVELLALSGDGDGSDAVSSSSASVLLPDEPMSTPEDKPASAVRFFPIQSEVALKVLQWVSFMSTITLSYFVPLIAGAVTTLLVHADAGDALTTSVAVFLLLCVVVIFGGLLFMIVRYFEGNVSVVTLVLGERRELEYENKTTVTKPFCEGIAPFFESSGKPFALSSRLYFFEDIGMSISMMVVTSIKPYSTNGCLYIGVSMCCIGMCHILYVGLVRPYQMSLEAGFMLLHGVVQLAMCICGVVSIYKSSAATALAYLIAAEASLFFIQAVVMGIWSIWHWRMQKSMRRDKDVKEEPLLPSSSSSSSSTTSSDDAIAQQRRARQKKRAKMRKERNVKGTLRVPKNKDKKRGLFCRVCKTSWLGCKCTDEMRCVESDEEEEAREAKKREAQRAKEAFEEAFSSKGALFCRTCKQTRLSCTCDTDLVIKGEIVPWELRAEKREEKKAKEEATKKLPQTAPRNGPLICHICHKSRFNCICDDADNIDGPSPTRKETIRATEARKQRLAAESYEPNQNGALYCPTCRKTRLSCTCSTELTIHGESIPWEVRAEKAEQKRAVMESSKKIPSERPQEGVLICDTCGKTWLNCACEEEKRHAATENKEAAKAAAKKRREQAIQDFKNSSPQHGALFCPTCKETRLSCKCETHLDIQGDVAPWEARAEEAAARKAELEANSITPGGPLVCETCGKSWLICTCKKVLQTLETAMKVEETQQAAAKQEREQALQAFRESSPKQGSLFCTGCNQTRLICRCTTDLKIEGSPDPWDARAAKKKAQLDASRVVPVVAPQGGPLICESCGKSRFLCSCLD